MVAAVVCVLGVAAYLVAVVVCVEVCCVLGVAAYLVAVVVCMEVQNNDR